MDFPPPEENPMAQDVPSPGITELARGSRKMSSIRTGHGSLASWQCSHLNSLKKM
jgi:hypothetical protein